MFQEIKDFVIRKHDEKVADYNKDLSTLTYYKEVLEELETQNFSETIETRLKIRINLNLSSQWSIQRDRKYLDLFKDFIDTPEQEIFNKLMENKDLYANIVIYRKKELKEQSIKEKIKLFLNEKKEFSNNYLLRKIINAEGELKKKIKQSEYQLKQKIERLNFLENQPKELLLVFKFDKSMESTIKYNAYYTKKIPIKQINHKEIRSVTEENDYYRISDFSGFEGWLPKQYYEFQSQRLATLP